MPCVFDLSPERHEVLSGTGEMAIAEGVEHGDGRLVLHSNGFAILEAVDTAEVADLPGVSTGRREQRRAGASWACERCAPMGEIRSNIPSGRRGKSFGRRMEPRLVARAVERGGARPRSKKGVW
jgi:hypothetical protein